MKVTGKDNEGTVQEIELDNVRFFGAEIFRNKDKQGNFKSFHTVSWVKDTGNKIFLEDWKISHLKKYFSNYTSSKRFHTEEKNGKIKKATEWICEVIEKGTVALIPEDVDRLILDNQHRRMFIHKGQEYFFILDKLFRNNYNNQYYYFDEEEGKLINLGYEVIDWPKKETLLEAIEKYKESKVA